MKYKAFISYRHLEPDRTAAIAVHRMLEKYVIPRRLRRDGEKRLGRVFRDEDELPLSGNLSESIQTALEESEYLIVVCSPQLRESIWCMKEVDTFLRTRDRGHVLAVLVSGTPDESFPPQLLQDENGNPCEPFAANLTSDGTNSSIRGRLRQEHLRLVAALIGCDYDDLVQRARRRRARLAAAAALVTLAAALAFISVLLIKNAQVSRALRQAQRNESEALSHVAANMLSRGDRSGAARTVISALPGAEDPDRPYVAECEKVLAEALSVYHDPSLFLQRALVDTSLEIKSVAVARDGSAAYTAYQNGVVKAVSPYGSILWETVIPEWKDAGEAQVFIPGEEGVFVSAEKGFCVLDPASGTILRQEKSRILACRDRLLLMQKPYMYERKDANYYLADPEGNVLREFDPELDSGYTVKSWGLSSGGKIAILAEGPAGDDTVALMLPDEATGRVKQTVPIGTDDMNHIYSLCMTDDTVFVFAQEIDWMALFASDESSTGESMHTVMTAYRLTDGAEAWHWETDELSVSPWIFRDTYRPWIAALSPFSPTVTVLSEADGQRITETRLTDQVKAFTSYMSNAGNYCYRAVLKDGSVVSINPEAEFHMAFGGSSVSLSAAEAGNPDGKIFAAGIAADAPQELVLISKMENPGDRLLLDDLQNTTVAVSPDGKILTASSISDSEMKLYYFDPASPDAGTAWEIPAGCYYDLLGITEEGSLAVFGNRDGATREPVFVSLEDGSYIIRENEKFDTIFCSRPAKDVWSVQIPYKRDMMKIRQNGREKGETALPKGAIHGSETLGSGWMAVTVPAEGEGYRIEACDLSAGTWRSQAEERNWSEPILACAPGQKQLAVADSDGVFLLDESLRIIRSFPLPADRSAVTGMEFSGDGELLCLVFTGKRICLIRLADGVSSGIVSCDYVSTELWAERTASGDYAVSFGGNLIYPGYIFSGKTLSVRARVPGLGGIIPGTDTMIRCGELQYFERMILSPVYSLEELMEMSEDRFQ